MMENIEADDYHFILLTINRCFFPLLSLYPAVLCLLYNKG